MSSSHNALSAASDDRKARLAKLKNLKRKQPGDEIVAPESERALSPPQEQQQPPENDITKHLSGRNYDHETRGPKLGFETAPTLNLEQPTLEERAADVEEEVTLQAAIDAQDDKGVDLFKLQPKKPNWDLKRELDRKMEVLNVRTDNAIARLVRDRITGAQKSAAERTKAVEGEGDAAGMDGVALVEGLRVREREEEEEERREREEEAELLA